jgi:hypothetical protein
MDDKPNDWVDFAAAKAVRFEVALEAFGLMGSLRRDGEQLQGVCPLHKASRPAAGRSPLRPADSGGIRPDLGVALVARPGWSSPPGGNSARPTTRAHRRGP